MDSGRRRATWRWRALILGPGDLAAGPAPRSPPRARSRLGARPAPEEDCVPTGPVPTLSAAQSSNAETIVAAAETLGAGDHGAQIALMTAYTESTLENLGPESGNDGSLGLFQQRVAAGWGTAAEEEDPTDATGMFIQHLLAVPDWQTIAPWMAAQDVQGSAFA